MSYPIAMLNNLRELSPLIPWHHIFSWIVISPILDALSPHHSPTFECFELFCVLHKNHQISGFQIHAAS